MLVFCRVAGLAEGPGGGSLLVDIVNFEHRQL